VTALSDAPARDADQPSPERGPYRTLLIAGMIAVGVIALGFYLYTRSDMWLDEALSVNIARLPLSDLHQALKQDGAPPLYYVLLHVWMGAYGTGNVAARSLSGVCMIGAVVATWFAARRFADTRVAWIAAVIMAINPYAIRYATEARMYALEILFVSCGILAFQRAIQSPSIGRLAVFGVLVALFVYTQYWAFYLLITFGVLLAWMALRGAHQRAARRLLVATALGVATFMPWVPTFLYQRAHTGTPWGTPVLPGIPLGYTLRDFAGGASGTTADRQEGWLLFFVLFALLLLGVFARSVDDRHIDLDVRTQPEARGMAFMLSVGLAVALSLNYAAGGAFQSRYSAIVYPFFVLLVARGASLLWDRRIFAGVMIAIVGLGIAGGVRNVMTQRTQAREVARVLNAEAKPGDLVVYCPDQIGPAVNRLGPKAIEQVVYPSMLGPERIDWVDYKARLRHANVQRFADQALSKLGGTNTLWYVSAPGYITHVGTCEALSDAFARHRTRVQRTVSNARIFEEPALQEFPRSTRG
jgi:4-amino-4-deoxy-L-arabinose transferase-like glycosyltransferase